MPSSKTGIAPDSVEIRSDELPQQERILAEPAPDTIEVSSQILATVPFADAQSSRFARPFLTLSLPNEIAPLLRVVNSRFSEGDPLIQVEEENFVPPDLPRGARVRIAPHRVELPLRLYDFTGPLGARRQTIWTLLVAAGLGARYLGSSRRGTVSERRQGTLEAPLQFGLASETHSFHHGRPVWSGHRLVVSCEESDRVQAIRRQISLLSDHLANPANLLPLNDPSMMI